MNEPTKPCDASCPKCGSVDIHRTFRAAGTRWATREANPGCTKFANERLYGREAFANHIEHHCRTCQHDWQGRPLLKRKPPTTPPEAPAECQDSANSESIATVNITWPVQIKRPGQPWENFSIPQPSLVSAILWRADFWHNTPDCQLRIIRREIRETVENA